MLTIRNILISCGVFYLSVSVAPLLAWPFFWLSGKIIFSDGFLSAIAMGVWISKGETLAAILAGALVAVTVVSQKPFHWALLVAALNILDALLSMRGKWYIPPSAWDRVWQSVCVLLPAVACAIAALLTAHLRRRAVRTYEPRDGTE